MFNRELKNKIRAVGSLQGIGAPRPDWQKANREILLMQIRNTLSRQEPKPSFNFAAVWQFMDVFLPSRTVYYVVRPVTAVTLIALLVMGGWMSTVSASLNSLPGDVLYSVKLATESVQTTLASKPQETKLRAEFAGRRADEVKKIVKSNLPKKAKKVEEAVKHLTSGLEQVKGNLEKMKANVAVAPTVTAAQAVEVAKAVDQKVTEIQKTLDQTKTQLSAETSNVNTAPVQEQVNQAAAAAVEIGVKAVEVLVEKHQEDKSAVPVEEVKSAVDNKLKALEEKVSKVEEQISTMVATSTPAVSLRERQEQAKATATLVAPAKESTAVAKEVINQAKDELNKENFDAALDKLKQGAVLTQAAEVKTEATQILAAPPAIIVTSTVSSNFSSTSTLMNVPIAVPMATSTLPIKEEIEMKR